MPWSTSIRSDTARSTPASNAACARPCGDVPGDVERSWGGTEVADRGGGQADAELRHQLVEEPVVVVRSEDHDQFGVVLGDELAGGGERGLDVRGQLSRRLRQLQQRAVRHRDESERHGDLLG